MITFRMWLSSWYCLCLRKECSTQMRPWSCRRGWRSRRSRRTWIWRRRGMKKNHLYSVIYIFLRKLKTKQLVYKLKKMITPCFFKPECVLLPKTYWWRGRPYPQLTCSFPYYTKTHTCTTPVLFLVKNLYFNKNLIKKSKKFLSLVKIVDSWIKYN